MLSAIHRCLSHGTIQQHVDLLLSFKQDITFTRFCDMSSAAFLSSEISSIHRSLLTWYDSSARVLPWRRAPNTSLPTGGDDEQQKFAYGVWVSEIMLQQTRVQTVIDYWQRWMTKFPRVHDLANASLEVFFFTFVLM